MAEPVLREAGLWVEAPAEDARAGSQRAREVEGEEAELPQEVPAASTSPFAKRRRVDAEARPVPTPAECSQHCNGRVH